MILLLIMTFGRVGSVTGNILLPLFIKLCCWAPFLWLATLMLSKFLSAPIWTISNAFSPTVAFTFSLFLNVDVQQSLS